MRILIINPFYYPNEIGGTERVIRILAEGFVSMGHEVAVYTVDSKLKHLVEDEINGVRVFRGTGGMFNSNELRRDCVKGYKQVRNSIIQIYNTGIKKELETLLRVFKPEICHTNNLYGFSTYLWKIIHDNDIPLVHTTHDYWLLNRLNILFTKHYAKYVQCVTSPSNYVLNKYSGIFQNAQYVCIPNAVELDEAFIKNNRERAIARIGESPTIRFIYAGQLESIKGVKEMIDAFMEINSHEIELIICGQGRLQSYVKDCADKDSRIKYLGKLSYLELEKIYKSGNVLMAPSKWEEPFGMVAIEAFIFGLPVIGSKRGGLQEIIEGLNCGVTLDNVTKNELKKAISEMMDRQVICDTILYRNEDRIVKYDKQKQIVDFINWYKRAIERKNMK